MRLVIQRVAHAAVAIGGEECSRIGQGLLVLVGIEEADTDEDIEYLCQKTVKLRIFDDAEGVMNLSVAEVGGEVLVVSQFTLMAQTQRGNRPSYIKAARPEVAVPLYERFVDRMEQLLGKAVPTGRVGADMQVSLQGDGPVTILMDSKQRKL